MDYVVKPFVLAELDARIRAQLRAARQAPETTLRHDGITIDLLARRVSVDGEPVRLTTTEFDLLAYLMRNPGRGAEPFADPAIGVGLRGGRLDQRRRRLRRLPAAQTRPARRDHDGPVARLPAGRRLVIRRSSLRWRLVAWVVGAMLVTLAIVFVVVYQQTGSQLRSQVDDDVGEDLSQLVDTAHSLHPAGPDQLVSQLRHYVQAQPYSASSSLLFAVVNGRGPVSNHPELFGAAKPDDGETEAEQRRENREGRALLEGRPGLRTAPVPDGGTLRLAEQVVTVDGVSVRLGAGESLELVTRAQRSVARAFLIAGALGLALVLIASYLAGAAVSAPLRRMARVAARVDDGDLLPRMSPPPSAASEIRVLAESFNHMLDRLEVAFEAPARLRRRRLARAAHTADRDLRAAGGARRAGPPVAGGDPPGATAGRRRDRADLHGWSTTCCCWPAPSSETSCIPTTIELPRVHRRSLDDDHRRPTAPAGARARSRPAP